MSSSITLFTMRKHIMRGIFSKHKLDTVYPPQDDSKRWTSQQNHEARLSTHRSGAFILNAVVSICKGSWSDNDTEFELLQSRGLENSLCFVGERREGRRDAARRSRFILVCRLTALTLNQSATFLREVSVNDRRQA